ncbi:LysM peptidoglycan-binding domain-containing protein [Gemmobacter lanyuensis]
MIRMSLVYLTIVIGIAWVITGGPSFVSPPEPDLAAIFAEGSPPGAEPVGMSTSTAAALAAVAPPGQIGLGRPLVRGGCSPWPDHCRHPAGTGPAAQGTDPGRDGLSGAVLRRAFGPAQPAGPARNPGTSLEGLVAQALREGQSDAYIDALVNEAAGQGQLSVPAALVTASGQVDTAVLLASLVQEARIAAGFTPRPSPERRIPDSSYTVQPGDSLGAIALRFYGDAALFPALFAANQPNLASPDQLQPGQTLILPDRAAP